MFLFDNKQYPRKYEIVLRGEGTNGINYHSSERQKTLLVKHEMIYKVGIDTNQSKKK